MNSTQEQSEAPIEDTFSIYQLRRDLDFDLRRDLSFESIERLTARGKTVALANYDCVYTGGVLDESDTLDTIYEKFNLDRPDDFTVHSLSVSDMIVTVRNGVTQAFYVDSVGFEELPEISKEIAELDSYIGAQIEWDGYKYEATGTNGNRLILQGVDGKYVDEVTLAELTLQDPLPAQKTVTVQTNIGEMPISAGSLLTASDLQTVEVSSYHLPTGTIFEPSFAVGKYLRADALAGDYVTGQRLSQEYPGDDPYLLDLPEGEMAISVSLPELAQSVSGKLRSGDVIQIFAVSEADDDAQIAEAPLELQYVEVLTATYQSGIDVKDGDYAKNAEELNDNTLVTVTLLVNSQQAAVIAGLQRQSVLYAALVIRGNDARKDAALKAQDDYFAALAAADAAAAATELEAQPLEGGEDVQPEDQAADTSEDAANAKAAPASTSAEGGT